MPYHKTANKVSKIGENQYVSQEFAGLARDLNPFC